jgi:hypothetical protein
MSIEHRFLAKVEKTDSCWHWKAGTTKGYGRFWVGDRKTGRTAAAHRVSYQLFVGPIPDGMALDHLCRNRRCVNPQHLEPVTSTENVMRGMSAPAQNAGKTHCLRGHEFTPENTYLQQPKGWRQCRTCYSIRYSRKARGGHAA